VSQPDLTVELTKVGDATVLGMRGSLVRADNVHLEEALRRAREQSIRVVVMDFSRVSRLNSPGTSLLVKQYAIARRSGQRLLVVGLDDVYRRVFELTNLDRAMKICDSLSDALSVAGAGVAAGSSVSRVEEAGTLDQSIVEQRRSEAELWARPISRMQVPKMPAEAVNLNVGGRRAVGPVLGFGPLWEKTYEISFDGANVAPAGVIQALNERFPSFQPPENRFYASTMGISPGGIVLINATSVGLPVYTGVLVSYADEECFTFMTPQGHPESGWVTFQAFTENGHTTCRIQGLARANDPVYEVAFRMHGSAVQERIWKHVLKSLGEHLGQESPVSMKKTCVDDSLQWSQTGNVRYNAQIWSLLYLPLLPFRRKR